MILMPSTDYFTSQIDPECSQTILILSTHFLPSSIDPSAFLITIFFQSIKKLYLNSITVYFLISVFVSFFLGLIDKLLHS